MKRVEQLYAFIAEDDDQEGIPAANLLPGFMIPLVGADMARIDSMREVAQDIATSSGKTLRLCRFEVRTELEVFEP